MRITKKLATGLVIAVAVGLLSAATQAAPLYGSEFGGSGLYEINTANGSAVNNGAAGHLTPGLAYNGQTGTMYANGYSGLHTIDTSTGATSFVGGYGGSGYSGLTFSGDSASLYAIRGGDFYSINQNTAATTFIGNLGGPTDSGVVDLATDSTGTIYMMGLDQNLYTVNEASGLSTLVGAVSGIFGGIGVTAISFDENDVLHGVTTSGDRLITIDVITLTSTTIGGDIGNDIRGLAFAIEATQVPEPGALAILGIGLAGLGFARRKRAA
ncbi:MAG: hypothetical protein ACI9JL_004265 [Paracoccaceae bacterium]|jgi:hypothetical protein